MYLHQSIGAVGAGIVTLNQPAVCPEVVMHVVMLSWFLHIEAPSPNSNSFGSMGTA